MEEKGSLIGIKDFSCLLRGRAMGWAAVTIPVSSTSKLAFQPYPGCGDHTAGMDLFHIGGAALYPGITVFFQIVSRHVCTVDFYPMTAL